MTDHTSEVMILRKHLLHSVGGGGKIILTEKMLTEAGLKPGMYVEIVVKKGSIAIFPLFREL
jgi:hypothetical protein